MEIAPDSLSLCGGGETAGRQGWSAVAWGGGRQTVHRETESGQFRTTESYAWASVNNSYSLLRYINSGTKMGNPFVPVLKPLWSTHS